MTQKRERTWFYCKDIGVERIEQFDCVFTCDYVEAQRRMTRHSRHPSCPHWMPWCADTKWQQPGHTWQLFVRLWRCFQTFKLTNHWESIVNIQCEGARRVDRERQARKDCKLVIWPSVGRPRALDYHFSFVISRSSKSTSFPSFWSRKRHGTDGFPKTLKAACADRPGLTSGFLSLGLLLCNLLQEWSIRALHQSQFASSP